MPKLDLSALKAAKSAAGGIKAMKGMGWAWNEPSAGKQPLAYVTRRTATGSAAVRTFAGVELGTPSASRDILIAIPIAFSADSQVTGVKVNGEAATLVIKIGNEGGAWNAFASLWKVRVPAGSTGTVEVTHKNNASFTTIIIYAGPDVVLTGSGATQGGAGSATTSVTLADAGAGDRLFAFGVALNTTSVAWTGAAEQFEENPTSSVRTSAAEGLAAAGGNTVSFTLSSGTRAALIAFTAA